MDDLIRKSDAIDMIHKTIYGFFDIDEESEEPISDKDELLLEVNKAICNGIKGLPTSELAQKLIEARAEIEKSINDLYKNGKYHSDAVRNNGEMMAEGMRLALKCLDEAEPEEAKWTEKEVTDDFDAKVIQQWQSARCSKCGCYHTTPYLYYFTNHEYCPSCGRKMEGAEE